MRNDMLFHREIARISLNPIFPAIVEALFDWASTSYRSIVHAPGAESLTLAEHKKIIEAIAAHDSALATQAMQDHLNRANELYKTAVKQQ
jgi:DNA-binding FadR family transcriptional regulator